jgi:hypothetical protein
MKLILISLAALVAVAFGQNLPSAGNVRKSRRVQYSGGYKDGVRIPEGTLTFFLSYVPGTIYSSLLDPSALLTGPAPANNATFIFTVVGAATPYTPDTNIQPVNVNILGAPTFREVQIVAEPGSTPALSNIEFAVQGCFDMLTLTPETTDQTGALFGALCYQGFVTGITGVLVITGGSGDFTAATGTIYQEVTGELRAGVFIPTLVTLFFVLNLAF